MKIKNKSINIIKKKVSNITHTPLLEDTGKWSTDLVSVREQMSNADAVEHFIIAHQSINSGQEQGFWNKHLCIFCWFISETLHLMINFDIHCIYCKYLNKYWN